MNTVLWIVQMLLALMFVMAGFLKAFNYDKAKANARMTWVSALPKNLIRAIGMAEILGGVGLILPMLTGIMPVLTPVAAGALALVMAGAIVFHLSRHEYGVIVGNIVLMALALVVLYGRGFAPVA